MDENVFREMAYVLNATFNTLMDIFVSDNCKLPKATRVAILTLGTPSGDFLT